MEQQDLNKRLLLALALSFFVFVGYSYLFPPQNVTQSAEQTNKANIARNSVSATNPVAPNTAPITKQDNRAPETKVSSEPLLVTVNSKTFKMSIDTFGRISQFELLENKYQNDGKNLQILHPQEVKPLEVRFSDSKLNEEAFKTPYTYVGNDMVDVTSEEKTITLTQKLSSVTLTKKIMIKPTGAYTIDITTSSEEPYFITPGHRPMADSSHYMLVRGALVKGMDNIILTVEDGDSEGNEKVQHAKIASAFDRYVASMFYNFDTGMNISIVKEKDDNPLIFVEGGQNLHLGGYIGPKEYHTLKAINPELTDTIEFGFFTFLSKPFYKVLLWIEGVVGNWGWAIVLFTLLVKLILFPLSYKGMMSMQKLKDLAPKMKELKAKFKDDPAKMNIKMMEMYKKEGANPMGGCLPMLLQIPVFFAF